MLFPIHSAKESTLVAHIAIAAAGGADKERKKGKQKSYRVDKSFRRMAPPVNEAETFKKSGKKGRDATGGGDPFIRSGNRNFREKLLIWDSNNISSRLVSRRMNEKCEPNVNENSSGARFDQKIGAQPLHRKSYSVDLFFHWTGRVPKSEPFVKYLKARSSEMFSSAWKCVSF